MDGGGVHPIHHVQFDGAAGYLLAPKAPRASGTPYPVPQFDGASNIDGETPHMQQHYRDMEGVKFHLLRDLADDPDPPPIGRALAASELCPMGTSSRRLAS